MLILIASCSPSLKCTDPDGCWLFSPQEVIGLAVDTSDSEPARSFSLEIQRGIELFIQDNPAISGHPLKITSVPVRCYLEKVGRDFSQMTGIPNLFVFIGPACSLFAEESIHLLTDAGIAPILPIPVKIQESDPVFLSSQVSYPTAIKSAADILKDQFSGQTIAWVLESNPAFSQVQLDLCSELSRSLECAVPIYIDQGITHLQPYLNSALLSQADTWVFLYSATTFTRLQDLSQIMAGKSVVLLSPYETLPVSQDLPLSDFSLISPGINSIPEYFSQKYEKRYNNQNTLISYQSYLAAQLAVSTLEKNAIFYPDGSFLLPRQVFFKELAGLQTSPKGMCLYQIMNNKVNPSEVECP